MHQRVGQEESGLQHAYAPHASGSVRHPKPQYCCYRVAVVLNEHLSKAGLFLPYLARGH